MIKRTAITAIGIIFCVVTIYFTYWLIINNEPSSSKNAKEEIHQLQTQLQEMEHKYNELSNENAESNVNELHEVIDEQTKLIEQLKEEIKRLTDVNEQLQEEINKLNTSSQADVKQKTVFLTFDDGPSSLTLEILDILESENVHATFFTIGYLMEQFPDIVKETYDRGHMILPHSYSHDYAIYTTFDTFYKDNDKVEALYKDILGFEPPQMFRLPGGSSNQTSFKYGGIQYMPSLTSDLRDRGYYYIDWNVSSGDASSLYNQPKKIIELIKKDSKNKDFIVLLCHDTKRNSGTAQALSEVIKFYKDNDYTFRTFRDITEEELQKMVDIKVANKPIVR